MISNERDHSESDTDSIFTSTGTFSSSSTVPGLGALSGKAIKRVGTAVIHILDAIIIRRRLAEIEATFRQRSASLSSNDRELFCSDLLELSLPAYNMRIRTRAFDLIMETIAGTDFQDLATALVSKPFKVYSCLTSTLAR
ncbi:hypothetical protein GYMLUDRAFT_909490 [Collybiopsis luxurians FD-317 M1]|nr:hypothetical protein GYMLUDRAFT_909490 [Collybiopsis luxurians FD-317 M1]